MFFIEGWIIALLTFPGVIVHEISHRFFCDLTKTPVYEVRYLRIGNPAGYVVHGPVQSLKSSLLISIGPLIVNTLLCALLTFPAMFPIFILDTEKYNVVFMVLMWAGVSMGMHAFPSNEDMKNFVDQVKNAQEGGLLPILAKLLARIFKIANALRIAWFDLIYAFCISLVLPIVTGVF